MHKKNICIGILGGGQLARMSAFQAIRMGIDVAILEKTKNSPAGMLTKNEFVGWMNNKKLIKKFVDACDIVTLENEFIDPEHLIFIESLGKKVIPSPKAISLIQDKYTQKKTLQSKGIPVAEYFHVDEKTTYQSLKTKLGKKFILKSRKMGYDGYGNAFINNENDFKVESARLKNRHSAIYAEKLIDFKKELAIMVVRTKKEIKTYPVVETIQKNHICHTVLAPASINEQSSKQVAEIGIESVISVRGYGIFGIELFYTNDGKVLVNEMAPRPHNSGHYSIEACVTSQFENHIRSVLNFPLGSTEMLQPKAVMINLLGKRNGTGKIKNYKSALIDDKVNLHIYGKSESRAGRKMGHITVLGKDLKSIYKSVKEIESKIII